MKTTFAPHATLQEDAPTIVAAIEEFARELTAKRAQLALIFTPASNSIFEFSPRRIADGALERTAIMALLLAEAGSAGGRPEIDIYRSKLTAVAKVLDMSLDDALRLAVHARRIQALL